MRAPSSLKRLLLVGVVLLTAAAPASAQNVNKAIDAFKGGDYESAAAQFYAVLKLGGEEGDTVEAQYGLAQSFQKLNLPLASLKYYEDIVKVGNDHPYFDKAVAGLLDVGEALDDDLKTPQILDSIYNDQNAPTLQKMKPDVLQRVHFVLGRLAFKRGNIAEARDFLKTVKVGNPSYPQAQYMLGLLQLGVQLGGGRNERPKVKYDKALENFENARNAIPKNSDKPSALALRDLASLAIARALYEQAYELEDGDPKRTEGLRKAIHEFQQVPRFSDAWAEALFERAWAHTVNNDYGKALGVLHSLRAPYFKAEFYPEAKILQAIVYYYNCQWDHVNSTLAEAKETYEPMTKSIQALLDKDLSLDQWYPLLQKSLTAGAEGKTADGLIPFQVASRIAKDPSMMKMETFLKEADREAKLFQKDPTFSKSDMAREMSDFANATRDAYLGVVGKVLKNLVAEVAVQLTDITTRSSLIALETKTAEVQWLEIGKSIEVKDRVRQPRPFIPDDTFQFWWFRDEYWIDELGYYEFTVKTECFE